MSHELCLEAVELGTEALRVAFKANALRLDDPRRWKLTQRMLEINHRLNEISAELNEQEIPDESRIIS